MTSKSTDAVQKNPQKETVGHALSSVLSHLAKKCEKAIGPDRQLDGEIWAAIQGVELLIWERQLSSGECLSYRGALKYPKLSGVARYTSSFDAARTLIPDDHDYILEHVNGGLTIGARVGHNNPDRTSWGDTDELALCAAALRARASLSTDLPVCGVSALSESSLNPSPSSKGGA